MTICTQLANSDTIQQLNSDYLHSLVTPMDGMWENAVIAHATFWEIRDGVQMIGYFCTGTNNELLRFHLFKDYQALAREIFCWIISTYKIQYAITSTIEPFYFSLCLDQQKHVEVLHYLFRDNTRGTFSPHLNNYSFRKAEKSQLEHIVQFYHAYASESGKWIEPFVYKRLYRAELYVLYDGQAIVATGECIPSQQQHPYADVGMIVAQSYRGKGIGSFILIQLKNLCYNEGWKPICSCAATNYASKKAIEKAGFISEHRMMKITF